MMQDRAEGQGNWIWHGSASLNHHHHRRHHQFTLTLALTTHHLISIPSVSMQAFGVTPLHQPHPFIHPYSPSLPPPTPISLPFLSLLFSSLSYSGLLRDCCKVEQGRRRSERGSAWRCPSGEHHAPALSFFFLLPSWKMEGGKETRGGRCGLGDGGGELGFNLTLCPLNCPLYIDCN
ncbi:hypothetical protein BU24DRAFT_251781 [Aaosphaeria arxii CBS 175.79]|uniref:Uncharacterized protein n=1 Tax=Aaosphaeria arxii CBS 175.79 TaxID=1450172 RepID=A0A6A5XL94_9PLEO|nr:uncharacterized protein BU24DRAFT_251781 [Aaosphaeria arxii CBS 175.79]KAF2014058.1 hypothetical protein BU24DRAFT_251781 [Aaosphaeria arxii CBS 175.79]